MASLALALFVASASSVPAQFVGGYEVDWKRTNPKAGAAKAIFGQAPLRLSRDGRFMHHGEYMGGYWRLERGRLVLIYEGFMGIPFARPDAELKALQPNGVHLGFRLKPEPHGSLRLASFGKIQGPIVFRRIPRRPIRALLELSGSELVEKQAQSIDAYVELEDRLTREWPTLVRLVMDPKQPFELRTWGCSFFDHLPADAAVKILERCPAPQPGNRQSKIFASRLVGVLSESKSPAVVEALLRNERRLQIPPQRLAKAIGNAKYQRAAAKLPQWAKNKSEYVREETIKALGALNDKKALPLVIEATSDSSNQVRIAAWSSVIDLSEDQAERVAAIRALAGLFGKTDFGNSDVLKALGRSRHPAAVPFLANTLLNEPFFADRESAAEALGELGLPEAAGPLLEAKRQPREHSPRNIKRDCDRQLAGMVPEVRQEARVRKAVVEALWRLDHPRSSGS